MRTRTTALGIAAGLCCLTAAASVLAATAVGAPAGGAIRLFVQPGKTQGNGHMVITGAVGDYGPTHAVNVGGKRISTVTLRRGTIRFDLTAIAARSGSANPPVDAATCSGSLIISAPAPIVGGTGLYRGISGTVTITEAFGFVGPRYTHGPKKGRCNMSNSASPAAETVEVYGNGTVSF